MEFQLEGLTDYLRSGALVVALAVALFINDRSKFIKFHILANLGFGVAFAFFPKYIVGFQVKQICFSLYFSLYVNLETPRVSLTHGRRVGILEEYLWQIYANLFFFLSIGEVNGGISF